MSQTVTLKDIAREAKLSVSAVSKALGDYPQVNDDTRSRVLAICEKLNYPIHKRQRSNGGRQRKGNVSLLLVEPQQALENDSYWLPEVAAVATEQGLVLNLSHLRRDEFDEDLAQHEPVFRKADGLLVFGAVSQAIAQQIRELDRPTVWMTDIMGQRRRVRGDHMVVSDVQSMAYDAASKLIEQGHQRIGFFCANYEPGTWNEHWLSGLRLAMMHHDLPEQPGDQVVFKVDDSRKVGAVAAEHFARMDKLPTAWLSPAVLSGYLFHKTMEEAGLPIDIGRMIIGGQRRQAKDLMVDHWPMVAPDFSAMAARSVDAIHRLMAWPALPAAVTLIPHQTFNFNKLQPYG